MLASTLPKAAASLARRTGFRAWSPMREAQGRCRLANGRGSRAVWGTLRMLNPSKSPRVRGWLAFLRTTALIWAAKKPLRQPVASPLAHDVPEAAP